MRNFICTISCISLFALVPTANAAASSKEESIGVGSGLVIGALAGGPVGAIIGSAIGAKLGDNAHKKNNRFDAMSSALDKSRQTIDNLELDVRTLTADLGTSTADLARLERNASPEAVNLLQTGIEMDLLFRTDEDAMTDATRGRLTDLATALAAMPGIKVQLDGFADERGRTDYNQALSERRVEFVREQLLAAGMDGSRISSNAHGEVQSNDATADDFALARKVSLKVFIDDSQAYAANPN
ncbi:MAG TPA: OmpA family protein [Woeseiaceae bacterium]|nr:OmpA family protein [Woeseiaceae bacterium]